MTMLAKRAAHEHVIEAARHKDEERPFGGEDNDDMEVRSRGGLNCVLKCWSIYGRCRTMAIWWGE